MATTLTPNIGLNEPGVADAASQNLWGGLLNTGMTITDAITAAVSSISVAGNSNVILTFSFGTLDQTCAAHFTFTGVLTGNITVFWPNGKGRMFSVTNNTTGNFTLTLAVNNGSGVAAGTTQTITQTTTKQFIDDGTNILPRQSIGIGYQYFTASTTYTPTPGMVYAVVRIVGGGGSGGAAGLGGGSVQCLSGGGAGEFAEGTFTAAQIGASQAVTIGAGGAAVPAAANAPGNNGSTTSLGALLTAVGGQGGQAFIGGLGGSGGTGTGIHIPGGDGHAGGQSIGDPLPGNGGASFFGGGGAGGQGGSGGGNSGQPGRAYGSGGGALDGTAMGFSSGAGANGAVIIQEFF